MNDDRQPTDWSEERLDDAFRARAAERPTPVGLAGGVRSRIEAAPSDGHRRVFAVAGLAAAAAVVLAVGISGLTAPQGAAAPSAAGGPDTAFGLPIIDVSAAIDVRDTEQSDREIAVGGYYAASIVLPCPPPIDRPNPVDVGCPGTSQWLLERAESVSTTTGRLAPAGPALHPDLALVDTAGLLRVPRRRSRS